MQKLWTAAGQVFSEKSWDVYPRPQLRRNDWMSLNGAWMLDSGNLHSIIQVPFCPESLLSGVETPPEFGEELIYRRNFSIPDTWAGKRILLHFGAVMRDAQVFLNGRFLCRHENGYLPFSADISEVLLPDNNELCVRVRNDLDPCFPWGKQRKQRGGMWYTPCSGIWQTVWLEPVPETYIRALQISCGTDWVEISTEGVSAGIVSLNGRDFPLHDGMVRISVDSPHSWSPEDPFLYSFTLTSGLDRIHSYFALRTLTTETVDGIPRLCLNGKPYFFHGLLDQGYWSDGLYTPATPQSFEKDILDMKALGFNTLRKHIKIEPEQFYYDCDRLGMVVFQDMVNNGEYRYVRDTVLPTAHLKKRSDQKLNPEPETRRNFLTAMQETVSLLGNHPCICLWTIFNEGWGQFCADDAYRRLKSQDGSRFVDSTSGWFHQHNSDVDSQHIYFGKLHLGREHLPQLLSEYGGYVWKLAEHSFNTNKTYGYRIFKNREDFVRAVQALFQSLIPLAEQGLCGAVYTQVSDVEDETNGILTFDRAVLKLKPEEVAAISIQLQAAVRQTES